MKKLVTVALGVVMLAALADLGVAQQKAWGKPTQGKLPFVGKQQLMTGKVTQVNPMAKTFTVQTKDGLVTFNAATLPALPTVGAMVDIAATQTPGEFMKATTVKTTHSNTY